MRVRWGNVLEYVQRRRLGFVCWIWLWLRLCLAAECCWEHVSGAWSSGGLLVFQCFETRGDEEMHVETESGLRETCGVAWCGVAWRNRKCLVVYGCSACVRFGLNKTFNKGTTRNKTFDFVVDKKCGKFRGAKRGKVCGKVCGKMWRRCSNGCCGLVGSKAWESVMIGQCSYSVERMVSDRSL